jgi:glycosyltransferase involved in cell wall biosynthesis
LKTLFYNHTAQVSGAERVLLLILAQLKRDQFATELLCPEGELQNNAKAGGVRCRKVAQLNARFTWHPVLLFSYFVSFISVINQVRRSVRESKPDLIHANSIRAGLVISVATVGLGLPVIWHVHDVLRPHPISSLIRLFIFVCPPARIVAVSKAAGDELRGKLLRWFKRRARIVVIYNAADVQKFSSIENGKRDLHKQLRLRATDPLVGIIGNLSPVKRQLELLTAFSRVLRQVPNAALLIVGSELFNRGHNYQQSLVERAKALGITARVRFLGQRTDVPAIIRSLDLLVLNSTTEACPLVVLEGLAGGAPVLSSEVGGVSELIQHGKSGWLVPSGDQKSLSEGIVLLLQQPELRALVATNGRRHVSANFSVKKFMTSLEAMYSETVKSSRAKPDKSVRAGIRSERSKSNIAVFHDNFAQMGGAEKVAEEIYGLLPGAILHTTAAVPEILSQGLRDADIKTSWMQYLPMLRRFFRHYFLLYPLAVESVNLSKYDLIVSSCFGYAKGVRKRRDAIHVCYCHTPMRWVWRYADYSERAGFSLLARKLLPLLLAGLKRWDLRASRQPDYFIANSQVVAERIKKIYGRESIVIPPPIDVSRFQIDSSAFVEPQDYYLILSRLVPYKRIDLAVEACTRMGRALVVIGDGPDRARLEKLAGSGVRFVGRQSDEAVADYAANCLALIFPGEEDFGMTPLEINAAGRPVIAFRGGGAVETVVDGVTGVFFDEPNSSSLAQAINDFETRTWNAAELRAHASRFDRTVFAARLLEFLGQVAPEIELETHRARHVLSTTKSANADVARALPGLLPQSS